MENLERKNSAIVKADFASIARKVRETKEPLVVQKHNIDYVALVPLEVLALAEKAQKNDGKK